MEGRCVFCGLDCLSSVVELSAGHASVSAEAVLAHYYLSGITHFSIKINNTITRTHSLTAQTNTQKHKNGSTLRKE